MKIIRRSLLTQLVSSFSVLSLVTVSLVSYNAYVRARQALQESVFDRLSVAASLKEFELNQWFDAQRRDAVILAQSPVVVNAIADLAPNAASAEEQADVQAEITRYFETVLNIKPAIRDIDILTVGGIVILSTDPTQPGLYKPVSNNSTYFEPNQENVIPNIYISTLTQQPTITFATPILDENGDRQAFITITLNLDAINRLISERTGLGETGETYLVKELNNRNVFVSGDHYDIRTVEQGVESLGINQAMRRLDGQALYENYDGVPVIGVHNWLEQNNVALMAELSQKEAFAPAVMLAREIFVIGVGSAGILLVLIYWLARHIARPVIVITDAAAAIEAEEFDTKMLSPVIERPDELGRLARVFQGMAEQVYAREAKLKRQVAELKIEIDQARKERQVAEITETDYFQELTQKARDLRQRRT